MKNTTPLIKDCVLPRFFKVRQLLPKDYIEREKIKGVVYEQLEQPGIVETIKPGMSIAITAGSRGIANYALLLRSVVDFCKEKGAHPFIIPAMGSHGGANSEGQKKVLFDFGITEKTMGCPIKSSMKTIRIGITSGGRDVYIDKNAAEADGIIIFHRIKPHTAFNGPIQSGLMKMMAIGLAKQYGAERCHERGYAVLADSIIEYGTGILNNANILFGLATIENAYAQTHTIVSIPSDKILEREMQLQEESFNLMPRLLIDECDVLLVDELGKNFTGDGIDPHITGTFVTPGMSGGIKTQRICVFRLSPESEGNGLGIGLASCTTQKCVDALDRDTIYPTSITSVEVKTARIPCYMDNDKEAIQFCIKTLEGVQEREARMVRIHNTQFLSQIMLSEHYFEEAKNRSDLKILSEPEELPFDKDNNLLDIEPLVRSFI